MTNLEKLTDGSDGLWHVHLCWLGPRAGIGITITGDGQEWAIRSSKAPKPSGGRQTDSVSSNQRYHPHRFADLLAFCAFGAYSGFGESITNEDLSKVPGFSIIANGNSRKGGSFYRKLLYWFDQKIQLDYKELLIVTDNGVSLNPNVQSDVAYEHRTDIINHLEPFFNAVRSPEKISGSSILDRMRDYRLHGMNSNIEIGRAHV